MLASSHANRVQVDDDDEEDEAAVDELEEPAGSDSVVEGRAPASLAPPGDESARRKRGASESTMA